MHLMCCNDAIGLEWVLCVCLAQFWSVQLNVLTLQCCLLHPSHQQVSLPVHQLHYLTSQFAVMLLVGGKGGLIVCVCACRGKGALHESSCFIPQSFGLLEYGKKAMLHAIKFG